MPKIKYENLNIRPAGLRDDEALRRAELRAVRAKWDEVVETHCGDAFNDRELDEGTDLTDDIENDDLDEEETE